MIHSSRRGLAVATAAAALLFVLVEPLGAVAHATLTASDPADKAAVPGPYAGPITLTFSEALQSGSHAELLNSGGTKVADAAVNAANAALMTFTLATPLASGAWSIQWTSVAADKDVARGTLSFSVTQPTPAPATPTPAPTVVPTAAGATASSTDAPSIGTTITAAGSPAPGAAASPSSAASAGSDVLIPIVVALVLIGAVAIVLVRRKPAV